MCEFVADFVKRIKECEDSGHKEPVWLKYWVTGKSSHRDKVLGICKYCHLSVERELSSEEHKYIDDFRKSIHDDYLCG